MSKLVAGSSSLKYKCESSGDALEPGVKTRL